MSGYDWRWKIDQAVERLRTRYDHIGRKTGAPFLAVVYPQEAELAVLAEWTVRVGALRTEYDVRTVDVLQVTQAVVADIGAANIVDAMSCPMPGADPTADLGGLWTTAVATAVRDAFASSKAARPVVCLQRLGALYPAASPRSVMHTLWEGDQTNIKGPVVVLVPGTLEAPRTYSFLDRASEFMYRGDLL